VKPRDKRAVTMTAQVKSEDAPGGITTVLKLSREALAERSPVPSLPEEAMNHQCSLADLQHAMI
jgi:hypothetical protein